MKTQGTKALSPESELLTSDLVSLHKLLGTSEAGLTSREASGRLSIVGANELAAARRTAGILQFLSFLTNPLVLVLLIASAVSGVLGDLLNASIIAVIVLMSATVNFVQTYRSQQAAERLREAVAPTASVLRDGGWVELPPRELVPGDVIRLSAGDRIPADARLLQSQDLHVLESALTGESMPVDKAVTGPEPAAESMAGMPNALFLGTSVVSGTATALVIATGRNTAFGEIVARLAARPPETEFDRGSRKFGLLIMRTVFFLVLFVFMVSAAFHHDPFQSLLFAVALAVGLTPEFLPMITTVTLSTGAVHMSSRKVIVKHLAAIQNFGSIDILCSDKTGTLTTGDIRLDRSTDAMGHPSDRVLLLSYLNSFYETGIKSPLDSAILRYRTLDVGAYRKLEEIPFDFERRRLSVVVENEGQRLLVAKGAPESILPFCDRYESEGAVLSLDAESRAVIEGVYRDMSAQGYRVLAVSHRVVKEQAVYGIEYEREMVLAGYLAFFDPPLEDAADALRDLRGDGVQVKILTGDNELVARHVCDQVGLDGARILLGTDLEKMSDTALARVAEQTAVFARVSPEQKHRIIIALKHRGHVVGFIGDGINDAPSLHSADVGISVAGAVDVAKDAADIILLEHSLRVLHGGITEGRKAFGNVMKYLMMGTSSNFGNMFSMAGASLILPFLPMLPTQILLNNFLYDLSQITIPTDNVDPSFVHKPRRWDISIIRDFMLFIGPISSIFDFLTFFVMLGVFRADEKLFHTGWFVESLVTQTLVLFVIRTAGNPLRSRPSLPLASTVLVVVALGLVLPFTPLAGVLGFTPLPLAYLLFLAAATATYLLMVEFAKRRIMRRFAGG